MSGYLKLSLGTKDLVMTITASGVVIVVRQLKLTCEAITSHVSAWGPVLPSFLTRRFASMLPGRQQITAQLLDSGSSM